MGTKLCLTTLGRANPGQTIVLDGDGLVFFLREQFRPGCCDGVFADCDRLYAATSDFVLAMPFKLVAVFDGVSGASKNGTRMDRRAQHLDDYNRMRVLGAKSIDQLQANIKAYGAYDSTKLRPLVAPSSSEVIQRALRDAGVELIRADEEADPFISALCVERNAFGVMAKDTDFAVTHLHNSHYIFLPSVHEEKTKDGTLVFASVYDAPEVAKGLSLPLGLLPILACLAGNDHLSDDALRPTWERLNLPTRGNRHARLSSIVAHLRGLQLTAATHASADPFQLSMRALRELGLDNAAFHTALMSYKVDISLVAPPSVDCVLFEGQPHVLPAPLLQRMRQVRGGKNILQLVVAKSYDCEIRLGTAYYPVIHLGLRPLRQRLYGLVFGSADATVSECFVERNPLTRFLRIVEDDPVKAITTPNICSSSSSSNGAAFAGCFEQSDRAFQAGVLVRTTLGEDLVANARFTEALLALTEEAPQLGLAVVALKHLLLLRLHHFCDKEARLILACSIMTAQQWRRFGVASSGAGPESLVGSAVAAVECFWAALRSVEDVNEACNQPFASFESDRQFQHRTFYNLHANDSVDPWMRAHPGCAELFSRAMALVCGDEEAGGGVSVLTQAMSATSIREGPPQEEGLDDIELARRAHMRTLKTQMKAEKKRLAEAKKKEEMAVAAANVGGDESDEYEGSKVKKKTKRGKRKKGKGAGTQSTGARARQLHGIIIPEHLRSARLMPLLTLDEIKQHERYRNGPCPHFSRNGTCNYSTTTCGFTHLEVDRVPCRSFFSGYCRYDPCRQSHNDVHRLFVASRSAAQPRRGSDVDRRASQLAAKYVGMMPQF